MKKNVLLYTISAAAGVLVAGVYLLDLCTSLEERSPVVTLETASTTSVPETLPETSAPEVQPSSLVVHSEVAAILEKGRALSNRSIEEEARLYRLTEQRRRDRSAEREAYEQLVAAETVEDTITALLSEEHMIVLTDSSVDPVAENFGDRLIWRMLSDPRVKKLLNELRLQGPQSDLARRLFGVIKEEVEARMTSKDPSLAYRVDGLGGALLALSLAAEHDITGLLLDAHTLARNSVRPVPTVGDSVGALPSPVNPHPLDSVVIPALDEYVRTEIERYRKDDRLAESPLLAEFAQYRQRFMSGSLSVSDQAALGLDTGTLTTGRVDFSTLVTRSASVPIPDGLASFGRNFPEILAAVAEELNEKRI